MASLGPRSFIFRIALLAARSALSPKSTGVQRRIQLRSFNNRATKSFRTASQYSFTQILKINGTAVSITSKFRSSTPADTNVTVISRASSSTTTIRENAKAVVEEQTLNPAQGLSDGAVIMRDHVNALTKLTEDALRLIIPFPHFSGYHDFTTLLNEEIKKTTLRGISAEESSRVISGLRRILSHYEDEAGLRCVDSKEDHPCINGCGCDDTFRNGTSPPYKPPERCYVPEAPKVMSPSADYGCDAYANALQDLVNLREAAVEHASQHSSDFSLIITKLGATIDVARGVDVDSLTTLDKLLEAKHLVHYLEFFTEKLIAEIKATKRLISSRSVKIDAMSQYDILQSEFAKNKKLQLQTIEMEDRIQVLEGQIQELHLQKSELEDDYQRLEAKNLELEADLRAIVDPSRH